MALSPPRWTLEELRIEAEKAKQTFRESRAAEVSEDYNDHFEEAQGAIEDVLELTRDLLDIRSAGRPIFGNKRYIEALRYFSGPPISADDLKTISEVPSGKWGAADTWLTVVDTVLTTIDGNRFPWFREDREPTEAEKNVAITATAAPIAFSKVATSRRNESKAAQEALVKQTLREMNFTEVDPRTIEVIHQAPAPGEFCGESLLGGKKGDVIARLPDFRILAIECKVSNSAVNSVKRINNEAASKATRWIERFGTTGIVPAAVIAGVFRPENLMDAQEDGLTIWWSHDISKMKQWIEQIPPAR